MRAVGGIPFVLALADPKATLENVGGKGMSLARLASAGLPVPGGFHVTTAAYRRFIDANGLQGQILGELEGVDPAVPAACEIAFEAIRDLFAAGETPAEIATAIAAAYAALKDTPVAVRSSATAEDLPGASFAGQQETYLNIRGTEAVLAAVKQCWASLWTARAIAYRLKQHINQDTVALAVVVQAMVPADAAGIMFTANPVTGQRDEMVINAAWGLGEAVVAGAVTPDTLTVGKTTRQILHHAIADKRVMTIRTDAGVQEQPVPTAQRKQPVLTTAQTRALAELGIRIETCYAMPMDIEWALAGGEFAILQARPITALPDPPVVWQRPNPTALYARGSLAEHIPSPVTPLFATLGLQIANQATQSMWERMLGKNAQNLVAGDGFYVPINGYVFGGVRMQARQMPSILRMSVSQAGPMLRGSVKRWQAARQALVTVVEEWERRPVESLSPAELLGGVRVVFGAACRYFTDIQTTLPAASSSEVVFTRFYNSLIRRKGDPAATTFLLGFDTAALRAEKSLFDIAVWLRVDPTLAGYVALTPAATLAADLQQDHPPEAIAPDVWAEWRQRFQRHLATFGRTAYEFDFANPTPQETSAPLLDAIKAFLAGTADNPYQRQRDAVEKREQATQAVLKRIGWPRQGLFLKLLRWAQDTGPMREDSIFDMGMGHPLVRRLLAELGRRLAAGGAIEQADDIYWLEQAEVEAQVAALERGAPLADLAGRIPARKHQWRAWLKLIPPVMLPEKTGWSRLVHGGEAEKKDGRVVLKGVGTSSGLVSAPACVLMGPEDFGKLRPGDVLVAVTTTPAWTPLFALAAAVVTDIGGPLSHSSIVAREYGIPAVMAARSATRIIQTGQMVTVDGAAGTVTVEG